MPPSVWGDPGGCTHQWGDWQENHDVREETQQGKSRTTDRAYGDASRRFDGNHQKHSAGTFCARCGAWKGCLGLEPSPQLYVTHLVEVFREVRRVLRKDGTCWLVLGDSFFGSGKGHGAADHGKLGKHASEFLPPPLLSSSAFKQKDLLMIPARTAIALVEDGWYLRQDIIWSKPNCMVESVRDRPTSSHEHIFLLAKSRVYYYDTDAVREKACEVSLKRIAQPNFSNQTGGEKDYGHGTNTNRSMRKALTNFAQNPGRNKRSVWSVSTTPFPGLHFAVFPEKLVEPMILAGTSAYGACETCGAPWKRLRERTGHVNKREAAHAPHSAPTKTDSTGWAPLTRATNTWAPTCTCSVNTGAASSIVLDPFAGAGTVAVVAKRLGRAWLGIELSQPYVEMAKERIEAVPAPAVLPALEKGA